MTTTTQFLDYANDAAAAAQLRTGVTIPSVLHADLVEALRDGYGAFWSVVGDAMRRHNVSGDDLGWDDSEVRSALTRAVIDLVASNLPSPEMPTMPAVGTIVRARHDLDGGGHFVWPKGWTGEVVSVDDYNNVSIRAHRYLGPGAHEWDNCRAIGADDGYTAYENEHGRGPGEVSDEQLLAFALLQEFEVIS